MIYHTSEDEMIRSADLVEVAERMNEVDFVYITNVKSLTNNNNSEFLHNHSELILVCARYRLSANILIDLDLIQPDELTELRNNIGIALITSKLVKFYVSSKNADILEAFLA